MIPILTSSPSHPLTLQEILDELAKHPSLMPNPLHLPLLIRRSAETTGVACLFLIPNDPHHGSHLLLTT